MDASRYRTHRFHLHRCQAPLGVALIACLPMANAAEKSAANATVDGVYLQDQISIDRLQLIASGRYDWYDQDSLNKKSDVTTPLSQEAFTMRLGALYELPMGVAPYVSYSESFISDTEARLLV